MYKLLYKCITANVLYKLVHLQAVMSKIARFARMHVLFFKKSFRDVQQTTLNYS